jgi:hypothetical protein
MRGMALGALSSGAEPSLAVRRQSTKLGFPLLGRGGRSGCLDQGDSIARGPFVPLYERGSRTAVRRASLAPHPRPASLDFVREAALTRSGVNRPVPRRTLLLQSI